MRSPRANASRRATHVKPTRAALRARLRLLRPCPSNHPRVRPRRKLSPRRSPARAPDAQWPETVRADTMNPQKRRAIFERFRAADPHPKSELEHHSPFELLVAVVLSAQATDKGVNKATAKLFPKIRTPAAVVKLGVDGLIPYVQSIGLFRNKAKNIVALAEILVREHGGKVPANREALEKLPGVGRKTANVVLNVAFGEPTIAVDTHIFRVANRTGIAPGKTPFEVETGLERLTPAEYKLGAHHWLILHGRYVCKARKPDCPVCVVADLCRYGAETT